MRFQTVARYSDAAIERFTRFSTAQVEDNHVNPATIERLARELMDARRVIEAARRLDERSDSPLLQHTDPRWRALEEALDDYSGENR
jgi:hypothetical protein